MKIQLMSNVAFLSSGSQEEKNPTHRLSSLLHLHEKDEHDPPDKIDLGVA